MKATYVEAKRDYYADLITAKEFTMHEDATIATTYICGMLSVIHFVISLASRGMYYHYESKTFLLSMFDVNYLAN